MSTIKYWLQRNVINIYEHLRKIFIVKKFKKPKYTFFLMKMIIKLIIAFFAALSITSINSQVCQFEQDVDYFGNDLSPNQYLYFPSQDLCCSACQSNSSCQAWTYVSLLLFYFELKINI